MMTPSVSTENVRNPFVYLDTNALNFFCDEFKGKSKRPFKNCEIPLSWPLVDEIECNSSFARTMALAEFAWHASNKKVLLSVADLVALEVKSSLSNKDVSISDYYDSDQSFRKALNEARKGRTPNQIRIALRSAIGEQKKKIQKWERIQREKWASKFGRDNLLPNDWHEFYSLLIRERYFNQVLYGMIETYGLSDYFASEDIKNLDHKSLSTLSIGIEFYVALQFTIDSQSKKQGKPDRGDLPDMQHCFYIGLCDYFVTDDQRVRYILLNLIDTQSSKIVSCKELFKVINPKR